MENAILQLVQTERYGSTAPCCAGESGENDHIGFRSARAFWRQPAENLVTRRLFPRDRTRICSWVRSARALRMVCSDEGSVLTPEIFGRWAAAAEVCFVVANAEGDGPVGFCTLSRLESRLPEGYVEFCHQVLDPTRISLHVSCFLCDEAKRFAQHNGFRTIVTRIVPSNRYALVLAQVQGMTEVCSEESWRQPGFRWFSLDVGELHSDISDFLATNDGRKGSGS